MRFPPWGEWQQLLKKAFRIEDESSRATEESVENLTVALSEALLDQIAPGKETIGVEDLLHCVSVSASMLGGFLDVVGEEAGPDMAYGLIKSICDAYSRKYTSQDN